jgi:exodeoxyribonuclease X
MELIFLDTETTGNDVEKDRLCQICYKTSTDSYVGYFKPPIPVSVKAMSITHITNKMLEDKPPFVGSDTYKTLEELLSKGILVAHNAVFDKSILENEGLSVPRFICTLRVARHLDPKNLIPEYNLQFLRYYLDLNVEGLPHDAEGDVNALQALFGRLLEKVKESVGGEEEAINKMIEISSTPSIFGQFNFGKYKDRKVEEVAKSDPEYLEWLLSQKLINEKGEEDWIYTLRHYLDKLS